MNTSASAPARVPDFFIVGAPKCGTTALFDYLAQHPNTWCPANKEPSYFCFDYPALQGPRVYADYLALFAPAGPEHTVTGEASVVYFYSAVAVPEIRKHYPDARLIIMIRNPVDMVYSFFSQLRITMNEDQADFARAWALQDARREGRHIPRQCVVPEFLQYRDVARLSRYIRRIQAVFPPEQVRILVLDDMQANPQAVFNEVTDYLGLPRFEGVDFRVVNANREHASKLVASLTERPIKGRGGRLIRWFSGRIKRLLGAERVSLRQFVSRWNTRTVPRSSLSPEFRRELVAYFSDEVTELEQLTGRDFSHWRK